MSKSPMMPVVSHPKTRPGGKPFDEDDKEFHLLERDGGIRQFQFMPYPVMLYRGTFGLHGKTTLDQRVVESEGAEDEAKAEGWMRDQQGALDAFEQSQRDVAEAAAETAFVAEKKMSGKAREEYRKKSAASEDHVTE
jgi:hypothetical protein